MIYQKDGNFIIAPKRGNTYLFFWRKQKKLIVVRDNNFPVPINGFQKVKKIKIIKKNNPQYISLISKTITPHFFYHRQQIYLKLNTNFEGTKWVAPKIYRLGDSIEEVSPYKLIKHNNYNDMVKPIKSFILSTSNEGSISFEEHLKNKVIDVILENSEAY